MKFALIIPDGAADEPQRSLGDRTPLQSARIPHMDRIAAMGVVGLADHVPGVLSPGSDVGTMSLFGYDPRQYHTGRAPLEAAAKGITLGPDDWAIRCNLVTVEQNRMKSFTADQVPTEVAEQLLAELRNAYRHDPDWEFYTGVSYRNLVLRRVRDGRAPFDSTTKTTPPHDIIGQPIEPYLPQGTGAELLRDIMDRSSRIFPDLQANQQRVRAGRLPATQVWLWGLGQRPKLSPFFERFGIRTAAITAVDLVRGLARLLGWQVLEVPGATGYLDTDYAAKGRAAVEALKRVDMVVIHVEATDEASHEGDAEAKIEALERIDEHIVGPVHAALQEHGEYRILVCPDHPTFLRTRTHSHGWVPFAACGTGVPTDKATCYSEAAGSDSPLRFASGYELLPSFLSENPFQFVG